MIFDQYTYRNSSVSHDGAAFSQPDNPEQSRFSISSIAWEQVPQVFEGAMTHFGLEPDDLDSDPTIRTDRDWRSDGHGEVRLRISLSTPYENYRIETSADGDLHSGPVE